MSGMADAFAPIEAHQRAVVMRDTWGHLAPERRKKYTGYALFTCGEFGNWTSIRSEFKDLPDSPWFYQDLHDFISDKAEDRGELYLFVGYYEKFKNGRHRFVGRTTKLSTDDLLRGLGAIP